MPELPEVETVRRGIEPRIRGRRILDVKVHNRHLRWPVPKNFERSLRGRIVESVERRAKYLVLKLDSGDRVLLHLGMSGRLFVLAAGTMRGKHDHLDISVDGGTLLRLQDPRRFGAALIWPGEDATHPLLRDLGPEPLGPEFTARLLFDLSRGRDRAVKNFLMDSHIVVGVGNIYASESLHRAGIRPGRAAGRVSLAEFSKLEAAVRSVLRDAIEQGGTTLKDSSFSDPDGSFGYFQVRLAVYDRAGQACRRCASVICRQVIGQRSSFYCPRCQK